MTLGSLFDGSGGFPLGGALNGITPVWASEIEPYPLKVTAARFPEMKQLGDVTKINGAQIDPVDIITFGSPCQDLSVAGKQAGIHEGARSSLFFEAIRIIKEMRAKDEMDGRTAEFIRPRYAVWENVPGAFSSHGGEDFHAVLQALAEAAGCEISIPGFAKWKPAGAIVADGWSIAWRVFDAQYWGVPQRRKRIYLVADFGGQRAGEILFERESVCGNPAESGEARKGTATDVEGSAGRSCVFGIDQQGGKGTVAYAVNVSPTLCSDSHGTPHGVCYPTLARSLCARHDSSPCVDRGQPFVCYDARGNGDGKIVPCCTGDHENRVTDYTAIVCENSSGSGIAATLDASYYKGTDARNGKEREYICEVSNKPPRKYIVRRLTPLECCRLQGFPDWWEDGVEGSDSARYKMWGNGVALPCVARIMSGIMEE